MRMEEREREIERVRERGVALLDDMHFLRITKGFIDL